MKKSRCLNSCISCVLSYLGHTDRICIGDCGLPIPDSTERIALAQCHPFLCEQKLKLLWLNN
ncbi:MAG: hypothetical protein IJ339_06960 [Oscillospiraceae bacterium]|nr:hypothetical protein [Oscillospiraceae bacterium]MBQ7817076.1 hypothetical protein [Oscillospiraceae bacterium]